MSTQLSDSEQDDIFDNPEEAVLLLQNEHFTSATQPALDLLGISSIKVFKSLHPAMISPEFQPDGMSSKNKADKLFSLLQQEKNISFSWQHITIKGEPFDVFVTLRLREEGASYLIDVHWKVIS